MRCTKRVNWTVRRDILKKLEAMKLEANKMYSNKDHSFGDIIAAMVEKQFNDPVKLLQELKEQKRALAIQMSALDNKMLQYEKQLKTLTFGGDKDDVEVLQMWVH